MPDLFIQHARWQQELVTPDDKRLISGKGCRCICMGCDEPLILRRGKIRRWHFAHYKDQGISCSEKSLIHNIVKAWIAKELKGQTILLPSHPELDSPQGFCVEEGWQEKWSKETKRRYDVVLEGMFLYEKVEQEKQGRLIFEVYYSNAKDDDFKLQTQKEKSYILEVNAKLFYRDGIDLTIERLLENSEWLWFTDQQKEEKERRKQERLQQERREQGLQRERRKQKQIRKQNWSGFGTRINIYTIVKEWIARELTCFWLYELDNPLGFDVPFKECGLLDSKGDIPLRFEVKKTWKDKYSQKAGRTYDVVFEGRFVYRIGNYCKRGHLIFQLEDQWDPYGRDFKLEIQKAKFCVIGVNTEKFYGDGTNLTIKRLIENSHWLW